MYIIPDTLLGRYRKAVVDPKSGRGAAEDRRRAPGHPGLQRRGEHYKRVPAGFDPAHPNAELLKHKGLYAGFETKIPEEFFSAELVDYCFERYEPTAPLHRWLMKLFGK